MTANNDARQKGSMVNTQDERPLSVISSTLSLLANDAQTHDPLEGWTVASVLPDDVELQYVRASDSIAVAKTLMHICDFSQIPVLSHDRTQVLGSVNWKSLARFASAGKSTAGEVMQHGGVVADISAPLLQHFEEIVANDYIFVRDTYGMITHVVTTTDLAISFESIAGPFIRIREIERLLREILTVRIPLNDIIANVRREYFGSKVKTVHDLTFNHYVKIFEKPHLWARIGLPFDHRTIVDQLETVNSVRNQVVHFRPTPLSRQQELTLQWCLNWLTECETRLTVRDA